ncbi:MAG: hypothetical protein ACI9NY_000519 [Kiritimatiellia bacterium]|jgi:hypothetical protein
MLEFGHTFQNKYYALSKDGSLKYVDEYSIIRFFNSTQVESRWTLVF